MRDESTLADREPAYFTEAQTGRVGHGDEHAIAQSLSGIDEPEDLLG